MQGSPAKAGRLRPDLGLESALAGDKGKLLSRRLPEPGKRAFAPSSRFPLPILLPRLANRIADPHAA